MKEIKTIYFSDELNEEFSEAKIEAPVIDENYKYGDSSFSWKLKHFWYYRVLIRPVAALFLKTKYHHKIVNRKVLKPYKKQGYFVYGNHTNSSSDALIPTFMNSPKNVYVIVNPANVAVPVLGQKTKYLGAMPLPGNMKATRNFMDIIKLRIEEKNVVCIYPEAHIWPFYTKIRPFTDLSFRYPVQYKTPVFCFTNTYHKRKFSKNPKIITYVDGPFFPDENLSAKEQKTDLRNKVYNAMCERAKLNTVELVRYINKKEVTE